jgi:hypothetical protein
MDRMNHEWVVGGRMGMGRGGVGGDSGWRSWVAARVAIVGGGAGGDSGSRMADLRMAHGSDVM